MSWNRAAFVVLVVFALAASGCSRTIYTNLNPQLPEPAEPADTDRSTPPYWRHFFLFGWVPGEMVIDAGAYCGGADRIEKIETRQSFAQGLIAAFAGYYINIYSPYTGRVVCDQHRDRR